MILNLTYPFLPFKKRERENSPQFGLRGTRDYSVMVTVDPSAMVATICVTAKPQYSLL